MVGWREMAVEGEEEGGTSENERDAIRPELLPSGPLLGGCPFE